MKAAPFILLLALMACTYTPRYTGITCGPNQSCPDGYMCIQNHCYPERDEPAEEIGPDGDAGTDDVGADDGGAGDDGTGGDDGGPGDDGGAGDDGGGADDADCFPACEEGNLCQLVNCGGVDYVCRAFFGPLRFDWHPTGSDPPHWCKLSDNPGPVLDTLRCTDGLNLQYDCPWDGMCSGGQCVHNPAVERTHFCGAAFGCAGDSQSGYCRTHRKEGESCDFNFDCESFCCSHANNAQCIAYNATQCKIHTTLYWEFTTLYTWIARGTSDFHDIDQWTYQGGENGTKCTGDSNCDSGHCRHFTIAGENRCDFDPCVDVPEAVDIKSSYFCRTGDHLQHMVFVTNQNPLPPPDACD